MTDSWVSFDPGKTTGMTFWVKLPEKEEPQCIMVNQFNEQELDDFLEDIGGNPLKQPDVFIIEKYTILAHKAKAHIGSNVPTIEIIGQLKYFARKHKIEIVLQPANILDIAQLWSGKKMPSDHSRSHWVSAYLHAYYYLHNKGLLKARVLKEEEK